MAIVPLDRVEYFVFAGGGAKGLVHLGAVRAIEQGLGRKSLGQVGHIHGYGGASAGALIAMMLALEETSSDMENRLRWLFELTSDQTPKVAWDAGMDHPTHEQRLANLLKQRVVADGIYREHTPDPRLVDPALADIRKDLMLRETIAGSSRHDDLYKAEGFKDAGVLPIVALFEPLALLVTNTDKVADDFYRFVRDKTKGGPFAWVARTRDEFDRYFFNFLFHGGLLPGLMLRRLVLLAASGSQLARRRRLTVDQVAKLTFAQLFEHNNNRLAVTGTNLTTMTTRVFSDHDTPDFPVVDAVAISMTFPFLFKSVGVTAGRNVPADYQGRWVDGGVLNNLPIHAFDTAPDQPLNHRVVAFMIAEELDPVRMGVAEILVGNVKDFADVLLAQASRGQLRTVLEQLQTVVVSAKGISTLELRPPWGKAKTLANAAQAVTTKYFRTPERCYQPVRAWHGKDARPTPPALVFQELARNQLRGAWEHVSPTPMHIRPRRKRGEVGMPQGFEVDIVATNEAGAKGPYFLYEAKNSRRARVTNHQARGIELLAERGGTISTSKTPDDDPEYANFPDGAVIQRQWVRVLRPLNLCAEFEDAQRYRDQYREGMAGAPPGPQMDEARGPGYPENAP